MASKRKCIICGEMYSYCPNCSNVEPAWKFLFDSKNCEAIWEQFNAYRTGAQDATKTEKELGLLDLSKEEKLEQVWKDLLVKIRKEAKPAEEKRYEEPKKNFKHNKHYNNK